MFLSNSSSEESFPHFVLPGNVETGRVPATGKIPGSARSRPISAPEAQSAHSRSKISNSTGDSKEYADEHSFTKLLSCRGCSRGSPLELCICRNSKKILRAPRVTAIRKLFASRRDLSLGDLWRIIPPLRADIG